MDAPLVYLSKLTLQKVNVFPDPGPFIKPLPILNTKMNGNNSGEGPSRTIYVL